MLPLSIMEKVIASTPKSVTMPNGDVVPIYVETGPSLEDAMQQADLGFDGTVDFNYPLITLQDISDVEAPMSPVSSFLSRDPAASTPQEDGFTADDAEDDYRVTEPDIKAGSVVVTATVGGTPGTVLVEDTDYSVVDTEGDGGFDTIRFLGGGSRPDNGTQFTVGYEARVYREWVGEQSATTLQVHAHAQTILQGDPLTRAGNGDPVTFATTEIHREDLMRVIIQELKVWSGARLPLLLSGFAAVRERGPIGDFSELEGRGVIRKGFDLPLHYIVRDYDDKPTLLGIEVTADGPGGESGITLKVDDVDYGPT